jgi:hypothetical protein
MMARKPLPALRIEGRSMTTGELRAFCRYFTSPVHWAGGSLETRQSEIGIVTHARWVELMLAFLEVTEAVPPTRREIAEAVQQALDFASANGKPIAKRKAYQLVATGIRSTEEAVRKAYEREVEDQIERDRRRTH